MKIAVKYAVKSLILANPPKILYLRNTRIRSRGSGAEEFDLTVDLEAHLFVDNTNVISQIMRAKSSTARPRLTEP